MSPLKFTKTLIGLSFTDSDGGTCKYSNTSATDLTITASSYKLRLNIISEIICTNNYF